VNQADCYAAAAETNERLSAESEAHDRQSRAEIRDVHDVGFESHELTVSSYLVCLFKLCAFSFRLFIRDSTSLSFSSAVRLKST